MKRNESTHDNEQAISCDYLRKKKENAECSLKRLSCKISKKLIISKSANAD